MNDLLHVVVHVNHTFSPTSSTGTITITEVGGGGGGNCVSAPPPSSWIRLMGLEVQLITPVIM